MILTISGLVVIVGLVLTIYGNSDVRDIGGFFIVLSILVGFILLGTLIPIQDGDYITYDLVHKQKLDNGRTFFLILDRCESEDDGWHHAYFDEINCLKFTPRYNSYGWTLDPRIEPGIKDEAGNVRVKDE